MGKCRGVTKVPYFSIQVTPTHLTHQGSEHWQKLETIDKTGTQSFFFSLQMLLAMLSLALNYKYL